MRQVIQSGLGIGFFTPVGFLEEIRRGELVHVPLVEPGLAQSRIGILVPRYRRLSPPARLMINHISERLRAVRRLSGRPASSCRAAQYEARPQELTWRSFLVRRRGPDGERRRRIPAGR